MSDTTTSINQKPIRIAFDMSVLGQGIKTGIYRVCDELFSRIARQDNVIPFATLHDPYFEKQANAYMKEKGFDWPWYEPQGNKTSCGVDVLFSPFYASWEPWTNNCSVLKVVIIYDLIAILMPQWFEEGHAQLSKRIYDGLTGEDLIFSISQSTKKDLLAYRQDIAPERIIVTPLAAGERFFPCTDLAGHAEMRARYGIPDGVPYFLSLATLEVRKNMEQVLAAFAQLLREQPETRAHLVLAGMQGWKLDAFKAALDGMGKARERVILTGFVEDADLAALYSDAVCFVYMSLYEGFGLPPLEAMACGTPVIASNTSSLPEVVGDAGILLDPHDTAGLCAAMSGMLNDVGARDALGVKGLERAKQFSWDRCAETMLAAIQEDLAARPKLSIITICYNEKYIEDTCRSVAGQTWKNFEWIVVDGGSTDGSPDVLKRYREHMRVFISEKDHGRYDAMNKGIAHARGEYLLFLNGGDFLAHDRVLERIFEYTPITALEKYMNLRLDADILYGEVLCKETGMMPWPVWTVGPQKFTLNYFANHSLPHQATFIRRDLFKRYGLYDTSFSFSADYEWFMRVLLRYGASAAYIPMPVSVYNFEGVSSGGAEGHEPHMREIKRAYAIYQSMRHLPEQAPCPCPYPVKKWRYYLPEWLKRPLRPAWNQAKRLRAKQSLRAVLKGVWGRLRHHRLTLLPALRYGAEISLLRLFSSRPAPDPERVLIVRVDATGDYMLFRQVLRSLCRLPAFQGKRVTLCGNEAWRDLAETLDGEIFDAFIPVRLESLSNQTYRRALFNTLRGINASVALHPTFSRDFAGDTLIWASGAAKRIGFDCPPQNLTRICKKLTNNYYTTLFPPDPGYPFELFRNYEFLRHLGWTPEPISLERPELPANIESMCSEAVRFHLGNPVFFIGAQHNWRRWPASSFAALAQRLPPHCRSTIVLTGGTDCHDTAESIHKACPSIVSNLTGKTTLTELLALIANAPFVVSNDSVGAHIAAMCRIPTIIISNGQHFGRFHPYPPEIAPHVKTLYPAKFGVEILGNTSRYYWGLSPFSIKDVSVDDVVDALSQLMKLDRGSNHA